MEAETIVYADYETASEDYAQRFSGAIGSWLLSIQAQAVLRALGNSPKHVLDIGGGHGQLVGPLVAAGHKVTVASSGGVYHPSLAPYIQQGSCTVAAADLLNLPYEDRAFDAVVSVRLLPHMDDLSRLVREMCRVSRELVVVDYPTTGSLNRVSPLLFRLKKRLEGNTRPYRLFSDHEVADAFAAAGFRRQCRIGEFFWPMVLHRVIGLPTVAMLLEAIARPLRNRLGSPVVVGMTRVCEETAASGIPV